MIRVSLVTPDEWKLIKDNFKCDVEIKVTVESLNQDKLTYLPGTLLVI